MVPERAEAILQLRCIDINYEARPGAASKPLPARYHRHEPEKTPLYRVVHEHLQTLLEQMRARTDNQPGLLSSSNARHSG